MLRKAILLIADSSEGKERSLRLIEERPYGLKEHFVRGAFHLRLKGKGQGGNAKCQSAKRGGHGA